MGAFEDSLDADMSAGFTPKTPWIYSMELQRTDDWMISRSARTTGTTIKNMMHCTTKTSRIDWSRPEKLMDFGKGFYRNIFRMAMEKKNGTCFESVDALEFKYGRKVEPYIVQKTLEKWPQLEFVECGSIDIIEGVLSASPDGKLINKNNGNIAGFEAKAAMSTDTLYDRTECEIDHKSTDFWQLQGEMMALKVNTLIYATALPPNKIQDVLNADVVDDSIMNGVRYVTVHRSETHCNAILERARISGICRDLYLECNEGNTVRECVEEYFLRLVGE